MRFHEFFKILWFLFSKIMRSWKFHAKSRQVILVFDFELFFRTKNRLFDQCHGKKLAFLFSYTLIARRFRRFSPDFFGKTLAFRYSWDLDHDIDGIQRSCWYWKYCEIRVLWMGGIRLKKCWGDMWKRFFSVLVAEPHWQLCGRSWHARWQW